MFGYGILELIVAFLIAFMLFGVFWKLLKFALRTAIFIAILLFGLYLAFYILEVQWPLI